MIALTLGGALILFTCMAATLWMVRLVLLCCLCLCAITCHPSLMSPMISHSEEPCPEHT